MNLMTADLSYFGNGKKRTQEQSLASLSLVSQVLSIQRVDDQT